MPASGGFATVGAMQRRRAVAVVAAAFGLTSLPVGASAAGAAPATPFPTAGNITVVRLVLQGSPTTPPRLTLANRRIPAGSFVVASTSPGSAPGRFVATIATVYPGTGATTAAKPGPPLAVRLPAGYRLVGAARAARNVLYANPTPGFALVPARTAVVLAGTAPAKLPPERIVTDAQLLAFDRPVGLAEVSLLGLQFVTASLSRTNATTVRVTIGLSQLPQVNAVEIRFPAALKVVRVGKPAGTDALPTGSAVQLVASGGFFDQGVPYQFDIELSAAPKRGDFVTLRASTHYFESSLPFTERFALP